MRVLFITSRNAYSTSGELRLIKNRTEFLLNDFNIITDFEVLRYKPHLNKAQERIKCGDYHLHSHLLWNRCFVLKKIIKEVKTLAQKNDYQAIIFSSNAIYSLLPVVKKICPHAKYIADIHGASEELIEFSAKSFLRSTFQKLLYRRTKYIDRKYLPMFDAFLAVSDALIKYMKTEYGLENKKFFKIPCSISITPADKEVVLSNRLFYRQKYGLREEQLLFIYSGGTSPWQCIDKSVKLFKEIKDNNPCCTNAKMLIMTGQTEKVRQYESEDVIIDSYPGNEVVNVLCAGDFAFMLRDDYVTNHVAYPNKFLEYVACGLKVIATPYVYDVADQINQYDLGIIYDYSKPISLDFKEIRSQYLKDVDRRKALIESVGFHTTLKRFVDYIGK